jgi:hypothetical protein
MESSNLAASSAEEEVRGCKIGGSSISLPTETVLKAVDMYERRVAASCFMVRSNLLFKAIVGVISLAFSFFLVSIASTIQSSVYAITEHIFMIFSTEQATERGLSSRSEASERLLC